MAMLKLFLKMFIGGPLFVIGAIGILGTLIGGEYLITLAIVAVLAGFVALCSWDDKRSLMRYRETAQRRGLRLDYFVNYLDAGIVIDREKRQLLIGKFKDAKVLGFDEVSSTEWEDVPYSGKLKYVLHVNTRNFDYPRLGVGFAGHKALRDQAYAKLVAALNAA